MDYGDESDHDTISTEILDTFVIEVSLIYLIKNQTFLVENPEKDEHVTPCMDFLQS